MKTKILLLTIFISTLAEAKINPDSILSRAFKPEMEKYLKQVTLLTNKISNTTLPDSVRFYAKKLMRLSDDMEKEVNDFYRHRGSKTNIAPVFLFTGKVPTFGYALITTDGGPQPRATARVNKIYDCATNIRFLWSKNPEKIRKNLARIDEIKQELMVRS